VLVFEYQKNPDILHKYKMSLSISVTRVLVYHIHVYIARV